MKRLFLIVTMLLLPLSIFSQEVLQEDEKPLVENELESSEIVAEDASSGGFRNSVVYEIENLIDDNLFSNSAEISRLSSSLSPEVRLNLFEDNEKNALGPFFLNLFIGFGIGSFIQGDTNAAITQLVGETCATTLSIVGAVIYGKGMYDLFKSNPEPDYLDLFSSANLITGLTLYLIGTLSIIPFHVIGIIRPWTFASNFNNELKKALGVNEIAFNVVPTYNFNENKAQIAMVATIKF